MPVEGDTKEDDVWQKLLHVIESKFYSSRGIGWTIAKVGIDTGYRVDRADGSVEIRCSKGLAFKEDGAEPLSLLTQLVEAIDTSRFVGQNKVNNTQLKPLIEKLKKFRP